MASCVVVLAPNGRRQTVKCTPNTTIMQIIEEVCKKQGLKCEDFDIKHHNKILDTTNTFRFSGLPNNAQLELADAVRARVDSEVTLAVNLESGDRVMGTFLPDQNLMEVLKKLCPGEVGDGKNPVLVYTRNEIFGDNLKTTTLRSLGLRGGRAMLRLMHKTPEELKTQANVSSAIPAKPVEEKPYKRVLKTDNSASIPESSNSDSSGSNVETQKQLLKKNEPDFLKLAREKRKLNESPAKSSENQVPKCKPKVDSKSPKQEPMDVDPAPHKSATGSTKRGKSPAKKEEIEDFVFLGERNAMLFSLESAKIIPSDDLPEDFFELTLDDAKRILKDIRKKRSDMEDGVLLTQQMRDLEESKKQLRQLNRYKQAVIRVQFPDRTILQGIFAPKDTINDVCNFVREYLENSSCNFHLYTTPPKAILAEENRLFEVGCVPGALLHLGSDSSDKSLLNLKSHLQGLFTTNSKASLAASKIRQEARRELPSEEDNSSASVDTDPVIEMNTAGPSSQPTSYERKILKSTEKVPKWFKPSK